MEKYVNSEKKVKYGNKKPPKLPLNVKLELANSQPDFLPSGSAKKRFKHKRGMSGRYSHRRLQSVGKILTEEEKENILQGKVKKSNSKSRNGSYRNKLYGRLYNSRSQAAVRSANNLVRYLRLNSTSKQGKGSTISRDEIIKILNFENERSLSSLRRGNDLSFIHRKNKKRYYSDFS